MLNLVTIQPIFIPHDIICDYIHITPPPPLTLVNFI